MPRKIDSADIERWRKRGGKRLITLGVLVFVIGLLRYFSVSWPVVLMVAGILIILYGLYIKMK